MNIWKKCSGNKYITSLDIRPWRAVETQYFSSTRELVNTPEEHEILENLIESSKPSVEINTDYLIFTPFRYPPLKYGSRFGKRIETSLWYGSLDIETTFSEVAYYRLLFMWDTEADLGYIEIPLTVFYTRIKTNKGLELNKIPFNKFRSKISSKFTYEYSQDLGTHMRNEKIEAFTFYSARSINNGINIGIFTPAIFQNISGSCIHKIQNWRCITSKNFVEIFRSDLDGETKFIFNGGAFYISLSGRRSH